MEVISGLLIPEPETEPYPGRMVFQDGRIVALIPTEEVVGSYYICSGFIDSHVHPLETGLGLFYPDLSPAKSIPDVLERLSTALREKADSPIILGFNLEPERLQEHRYPYRRELDRLCQRKPVFVYRVDGHSGVGNSEALKLLPETVSDGVELDGAGKPTGVVRGPAYESLSTKLKRQLPKEIVKEAFQLTSQIAVKNGVTTLAALIGSNELGEEEWKTLLDALDEAPIRMVPFLQSWNPFIARKFGLARIGGCLLIDGSFGSHTAALTKDYADAPGYKGLLYHTDEEIVAFISQATNLELQTAFHAIGDRAIEQLLRCHESLVENGFDNPLRHRIEHAELLSLELIRRIAQLKLIVCVQPVFETTWGGPLGMYAQRLGERWENTNPLRTLLENGITVAGGSDSPITPLDPLRGIKAATSLPNVSQRIKGKDAFDLFTANASYSLGIENKTGILKPGFDADFVVLDADPRENPCCQVLATYCAGRVVYQKCKWR